MPYDSATGSSGPAHQACEYAVPIVCADIVDLREMAANEDMASMFYKIGDAADLAEQLIAILQSPELELRMAKQNYAAGVRMTMSSVIRNYLRWFDLLKLKKAMGYAGSFQGEFSPSLRTNSATDALHGERLPNDPLTQWQEIATHGHDREPAGSFSPADDAAGPFS